MNELLGDGRASLRSLAEDLDVSVTTVSNHLSDLEEAGVIQGSTPKIDYDGLGFDVTAVREVDVIDIDLHLAGREVDGQRIRKWMHLYEAERTTRLQERRYYLGPRREVG